MDYIIDKEIESLLTPPTKEEYDTLEATILKYLHVDPIVIAILDGKRILVDGHNRRSICDRHGIPLPQREQKFSSREEMVQWVIDNQLGRRNLTEERKAYYRGKEYLNLKKSEGNPQLGQNVPVGSPPGETDEALGKKHGVSGKTIQRDAAFAEAVDQRPEKEKAAILDGKIDATKQQVIDGGPLLCTACKTKLRKGQELPTKCPDCKQLREANKAPKPTKPDTSEPLPVDAFGTEVPKHCRPAYLDPWIQNTIDFLAVMEEKIRKERFADGMLKRKKHYPFFMPTDFVDGVGMVMNTLDKLIEHLKENRPAGVCPSCDGAKCADCNLSGMVPRSLYAKLKKGATK
jgi:rubrerythrin